MTRTLVPLIDKNCVGEYTRLTGSFTEETGGKYRIGIHVCSETHIGDLIVKNIGMGKGSREIEIPKRAAPKDAALFGIVNNYFLVLLWWFQAVIICSISFTAFCSSLSTCNCPSMVLQAYSTVAWS